MRLSFVVTGVLVLSGLTTVTLGQTPSSQGAPTAAEMRPVIAKAVAYLKAHQDEDGAFSKKLGGPGVAALVTAALIRHGYEDDPVVTKALKFLEGSVRPDGGVYEKLLANYTTSVALIGFKEANRNGRYDTVIKNAADFLKTLQNNVANTPEFGGVGYDGQSRPDLSNTQFFVEALKAAGVPNDDPAMKRAMVFLGRCQNLSGEHNDQDWAKKVAEDDKGGFVYNPKGRKNMTTPAGGLRSEGGMTYAGLKSFLYAGVNKNDPRVQAAIKWIARHYTLDENPGQGQSGLYYYYHTFAKAMDALGEGDEFTDAKGQKHNWKRELFEAIKARQRPDGGWSNSKDLFFEGDSNLCAAYCLMALSYCKAGGGK